ncbi:DUF4843 domain-containing protein [Pedobacter hiemivivus]|uniref:DUF4843 domain-containing protein n=1 Tax=Pedobacter hiemivivus TaxID=2530454 RepID=A0A4U1GIP1_9SPHI|nr:DUF4843 domain-containing protein [Pedobacter hiemivivus]TKC63988.1 DUF4843 domain-containing protein [Pedobacter hiemivivus]
MNKISYIAAFALALCLFASCKKESLLTYDVSDNIYFNYKASGLIADSLEASFAIRPASATDSVLKLPLAITGTASDHDRTYKVIVIDSNTTAVAGKHYVLPASFTIRAGRVLDSLPVKLLRSADLQTKAVYLKLALQPGGDFTTDMKTLYSSIAGTVNALAFKVKISDMFIVWSSSFNTYFGVFSIKKIKLINQVTGMPFDYYTKGWLSDLQFSVRAANWAISVSHYLADQKAAGHTVYENDGITEMKMGTAYQ